MRVMWKNAKKRTGAFAHIKISLAGEVDTAGCLLCGKTIELFSGGRTKESLLLEAARKHYYKHKLDRKTEVENGEKS